MIREAGPRDLDRLAALWTALAAHHEPLDPYFRRRPDAEYAIRGLLAAQLRHPNHVIFVDERDGELVGFCVAEVGRAPAVFEETRRAEITDLLVREDARRSGVGRALAETALDWVRARGVRRVEVRVAVLNREGQAFWRELGFGDLMDVLQRRL